MEDGHHLKVLLQIQLASDLSAAQNLPFILNSLTPPCFAPSSQLTKWTTRINSLLHSKEAFARWAGLCIAHKTATCTQSVVTEFGQSWLGVTLPLLSKNEPPPVLKAAIRLARIIFTSLTEMPEFQRQVSNPNVPKFIASLIQLVQSTSELEVKLECLTTLSQLIPIYPSAHRASHSALSKLALNSLSGNTLGASHRSLVDASSTLYSVLHFTGGKVGAAGLWRSSLDETLEFGWNSLLALRTTFPSSGFYIPRQQNSHEDPSVSVPLNLDRLGCSVAILCDLLKTVTHRHVQLPLGRIVQFLSALLTVNTETKIDDFIDPIVRSMEISAVPSIVKYGSQLLQAIMSSARLHLTPHATRLLAIVSQCLEEKPSSDLRVVLFGALDSVLRFIPTVDAPLILNRVAKAVIPFISTLLLSSQSSISDASKDASSGQSRKAKKRARNYEGDEVFSVKREVICPTEDDGKALLAALNVLHHLLQNEDLSPAALSICSRIIISLNLALPQTAPTALSPNPGLFPKVYSKIRSLAIDIACGSSSVLSKSLPLVVETITADNNEERMFDLLLHPRLPPLLRSIPPIETLSLYRSEESSEEKNLRRSMGLDTLQQMSEDVAMRDDSVEPPSVSASSSIPLVEQPVPVPERILDTPAHQQETRKAAVTLETMPTSVTTKQSETEHISPSLLLVQNVYRQSSVQASSVTMPVPLHNIDSDNDDDGEIPTIDMASDSEEDV